MLLYFNDDIITLNGFRGNIILVTRSYNTIIGRYFYKSITEVHILFCIIIFYGIFSFLL